MTFTPTVAGVTTGTLLLASNDPLNPIVALSLGGYGFSSYPTPEISYINPVTVATGSASVSLQVVGVNFFPTSVVNVNGTPVRTTYSNYYVSATLDASLLTNLGELSITVTNPAPGGQSAPVTLTLYKSINLQAADLIYDPIGKLLWVSIPAAATVNPNTVVSIDPTTGVLGAPISVASDPRHLTASSDGQYLYVSSNGASEIQRINLHTLGIERTFPLPVDPTYGNLVVNDLHVVPGSPQEVVASLLCPIVSPPEDGIALFNDSGLVNWLGYNFADGWITVDSFTFAGNPPIVYSLPITIASSPFFGIFTVDASGIHKQTTGTPGAFQANFGLMVASDGTLLYSSAGGVWNPTTQALVGTYNSLQVTPPGFFANSVIPDDTLGRTFFLDWSYSYAQTFAVAIHANDQASFAVDGIVPFLSSTIGATVRDLALWGSNGFAFLSSDNADPSSASKYLILFKSSIANSVPVTQPPFLGGTGIADVNAGGPAFTLQATGMNFVNGSIVSWNGTALSTTFVNGGQLNATVPASLIANPGFAVITVSNPPPGGGISAPALFAVMPVIQAALAPSSLSFGSQAVNGESAVQPVTLINSGQSPLPIYAINTGGNFTQTNNCGSSLAAGASCTINVAFMPVSEGAIQSALTVDDGASVPLSAALSGTGVISDFLIAAAPSGSTTATVQRGQPATYLLSLTAGAGYSGTVALTCAQVPATYSCSVSPASLQLQPSASANFTVTVMVNSASSSIFQFVPNLRVPITIGKLLCLLFLVSLSFITLRKLEKFQKIAAMRYVALGLFIALISAAMISCGGGASSNMGTGTGTASATYTLQIVASDGTTTHTLPITLTVQ